MQHVDPPGGLNRRERAKPPDGVARVADEKLVRLLDRPAFTLVLVTVIRLAYRGAREIEVEVRRQAGRPRGTGQDHLRHVARHGPSRRFCATSRYAQELTESLWRIPLSQPRAGAAMSAGPIRRASSSVVRSDISRDRSEYRAVLTRESKQLNAEMSQPTASAPNPVCLDERRPGADERVVDTLARREVAAEEHVDELRDELAEIWVEPVDVLRPLGLWQLALGPRQFEVDLCVESFL